MRIKIDGRALEVRVQERRVVECDVFEKGKLVASGHAVCAPSDRFQLSTGESIAVDRAMACLVNQFKGSDPLMQAVDASAEVLAKLDERRKRKAQAQQQVQGLPKSPKLWSVPEKFLEAFLQPHGSSHPGIFSPPWPWDDNEPLTR